MMYIASVFSQLERETIAERIRDNMHELAKTGRWLGGTTPTGYASESVKRVTVDGKTRRACHLKLIPDEAETVKMIYDLFVETGSLTMTEAELMRRRVVSKNGRDYTRFSIKAILQNPVYMIADQDAYGYFVNKEAELFSDSKAFDGAHGMLAYHRTDQEKGRATVYLPVNEWIVSVGQHPGLVPGKVWVSVQQALERNRSKAFRRPRSNEALLTGLLYCSCGSRMYPKLGKRRTADGKPVYAYVCKRKERSRRSVCDVRNAGGNAMDRAVLEQIKLLEEDQEAFLHQLERSRKCYAGSRTRDASQLALLRREKAEIEKKLDALVDVLADLGDSATRGRVAKRMEQLNGECQSMEARIQELEEQAARQVLSDSEFDVHCQRLSVFQAGVDEMTVEQKRAAVRTIVRKVIWDGVNAQVVLFGVSGENGESGTETRWGEDSK